MDSVSRAIREHPGMIIPLEVSFHNQLHREIPPIKPPRHSLGLLELSNLNGLRDLPLGLVIPTHADFLHDLGEDDSLIGEEARKQAHHLESQIDFMGLRDNAWNH